MRFLERFSITAVRLILGAILLLLTVVSGTVTCEVYGGAEVVEYGRDFPVLHLAVFAAVLFFLSRRAAGARGREEEAGRKRSRESAALKGALSPGRGRSRRAAPEEGKNRRYGWILAAMALFYLVWMLIMMVWGGSDSRLSMRAARALLEGDVSAWEPAVFLYRQPMDPTGYAYTYPTQNGLILYMAAIAFSSGTRLPGSCRPSISAFSFWES